MNLETISNANTKPRREHAYDEAFARPMPWTMKLRRLVRPIIFRLWRAWQLAANRNAGCVRLEKLVLRTHQQVFHPGQHFSSKILARSVTQLPLQQRRVLDMGTGSGVIGILAARQGAHVLAVDVNPHAVALAQSNAQTNGVSLQTRQSNLFASIRLAEKFDWIIFNPPFYAKRAQEELLVAYNAGARLETLEFFFKEARSFLAHEGKILLIASSDMALEALAGMFARFEYRLAQIEVVPHWFEFFYLVQIAPSSQHVIL